MTIHKITALSIIFLAKNSKSGSRIKHIAIKYLTIK